jgi:hypothetical protein
MVRVVEVKVKFVDADVWRTRTVSPLLTVPEAVDHDPLLILYSLELGPLTEIDAGELIPLTVMASEVRVWFRFTLVSGVKVKAIGVVSNAAVVTTNVPVTPPIVRMTVAAVEKLADDVTRTLIVSPLLMVPALLV